MVSPLGSDFLFSVAQEEDELSLVTSEGELLSSSTEDSPGSPPSGVISQTEFETQFVISNDNII